MEAIVADYFDMLALELKGIPVNKAERNRLLQPRLPRRSRGAIEFKHQNIGAVLIELGYPYIAGYKPRRNYQDLLRSVVADRIEASEQLATLVAGVIEAPVRPAAQIDDPLLILVDPPRPEPAARQTYEELRARRAPRAARVNWLEREARNRALAESGEQLALQFEHRRLSRARKHDLAERIEHVSRTQGDGLGFDILSFETSGAERLIEVKTTGFGQMTPFFASRNEVAASEERSPAYYLYRIYRFRAEPRMFHLHGSLRTTCILEPVQYEASLG